MKRRSIVALSLVAVFVAAVMAATSSGATQKATANSITVWLQVDAQSGWPDVVAAANKQFQSDHPGATVNVQYQNWGDHLQKFDATLAGGGGPDVIEMGNTEMTKYMAAGAFASLNKSSFDNSANWLKGLAASGAFGGKTYGVPYYAGSRVVTYRTDLFKAAGIKKLPATTAEYATDAKKLLAKNPKKGFSPVYIAGTDWYVAMGFVFDYGGGIAQQVSGKWKGLLSSPKSIAGLTAYKNFFLATSRASKTTDETHPNPYDVYAQGQAASIVGPSWFSCCVGKQYTGATAQFVMPGHVKGQSIPGFLGGSDLAVPATSSNQALASDWIKDFTSTSAEKALQAKGNIPNATNLLGSSVNERAAARSWFVPTAKHWVDVENGNILRNMLAQILSGKLSIKQAATSAGDNIASVLNQS
ncbi:MAG: N,N-diacetylchitobiose transport system substrate-binding protein [Gaiellaceae bacterium]|jgi:N,N'-diacetylchitobiose transport system substrate-binding protein|nr:N,N-diacetylchitobiose transport system substrate-binding protein [Gaiellaceae bacterium]